MPTLIAGAVAVLVVYLLLQMFRAANPVVLARALKISGGIVALAVAAFVGLRGELAVAIPLGVFGAGLLGWSPFGGQAGFGNFGGIGQIFGARRRSAGQRSQVRSQFLDMTLNHDSGELKGTILAGPYAGRALDSFDLPQLTAMMANFLIRTTHPRNVLPRAASYPAPHSQHTSPRSGLSRSSLGRDGGTQPHDAAGTGPRRHPG